MFDFFDFYFIYVLLDLIVVICYFVYYFLICMVKLFIIFEEVVVVENVCYDKFMVGECIVIEEVGVVWIVVDYKFIDFL